MTSRSSILLLLTCTCLALSACVMVPYQGHSSAFSGDDDHRDHDHELGGSHD